jgi:uncharacterized damage-inducible protein DinB
MIALETYLATHLRYTVWATRRTLRAVGQLSPAEYLRNLGADHGSVRGTLEHMLNEDSGWYKLLAGESAGVETATEDYYAEFGHLETDYHIILAHYEQLASFLTDLELATYFANSQVRVPSLGTRIPKWQGVMHMVNQTIYYRGQIAAMLRQLGHSPPQTDLVLYYAELEGKSLAS